MAHTKGKGSTKNLRDSIAKRLGVKVFGGSSVREGAIIVRQRGSKYYAGQNVGRSGDDSLYSKTPGIVKFQIKTVQNFNRQMRQKQVVHVVPAVSAETAKK